MKGKSWEIWQSIVAGLILGIVLGTLISLAIAVPVTRLVTSITLVVMFLGGMIPLIIYKVKKNKEKKEGYTILEDDDL